MLSIKMSVTRHQTAVSTGPSTYYQPFTQFPTYVHTMINDTFLFSPTSSIINRGSESLCVYRTRKAELDGDPDVLSPW